MSCFLFILFFIYLFIYLFISFTTEPSSTTYKMGYYQYIMCSTKCTCSVSWPYKHKWKIQVVYPNSWMMKITCNELAQVFTHFNVLPHSTVIVMFISVIITFIVIVLIIIIMPSTRKHKNVCIRLLPKTLSWLFHFSRILW